MSKVILGGGLGGLSAAYYLSKKFPKQNLVLIEATNRLGGWIKTNIQRNGIVFEEGPRTIRPRGAAAFNTLELIDELGISDKITAIPSNHPAAQKRMVYAKGQIHLLPSSFLSLFQKTSLLSKPLIFYLLNDLTAKPKIVEDEPIYDFVSRRFGEEVADYLISPLICGICAGNAKEISVKFLMKQLFEYEQIYGNICTGLLMNVFEKSKNQPSGVGLRAKREKWSVYSFSNGCETLPMTLSHYVKHNGIDIQLGKRCTRLEFAKDEVKLSLEQDTIYCQNLISSIPAEFLGNLVQMQHPQLSGLLKNIKCVSVAVVNLHYDSNVLDNEGFGVLVAPKEQLPLLGIIFDSCCFQKGNGTVLTAMLGGYWFDKYFKDTSSEDEVLEKALLQIDKILGVKMKPVQVKVNILKKCLPQYVVGHEKNLKQIFDYINQHKLPISLCGASFYGVGVNDVILGAKRTVETL